MPIGADISRRPGWSATTLCHTVRSTRPGGPSSAYRNRYSTTRTPAFARPIGAAVHQRPSRGLGSWRLPPRPPAYLGCKRADICANAPGHVCGCAGVRAGVCAGNCAGACAGRARAVGGPMQVWPFGYWAWPATFHIGRRGAAALAHLLQRPVWPLQQPPSSASRSGCSARAWACWASIEAH